MSNDARTLLVTGASGQLGRRVVELLLSRNAGRIAVTTRHPDKLADLAARGVEVRRADFDDPGSLAIGFAGADRLLLISTDYSETPGRRLGQHRNAVAAAVRGGVKHVVYTSLTNPGSESPVLVAPDHRETEAALAETSLGFTILRNNVYTDMLLGPLSGAVATGKLFSVGDGAVGYVTREDCARAAAAALAATADGRRTLDITGPDVVTRADVAGIASRLTGKPIVHQSLPPDAMRAALIGAGLSPGLADMLVSFDVGIARGFLAVASTAVLDLTGRPPASVADFLAEHARNLV